jgi:hypothetical protein
MIIKKNPRARLIDGKDNFNWIYLPCEIFQFAIHCTYLDISFLIIKHPHTNRNDRLLSPTKRPEKLQLPFHKIWFHSKRASRFGADANNCDIKSPAALEYFLVEISIKNTTILTNINNRHLIGHVCLFVGNLRVYFREINLLPLQ